MGVEGTMRELDGLIVRDGVEGVDPRILERLSATSTAKRNTLALLGTERRAKPVPSLTEYVAARASEDGAGSTDGTGEGAARRGEGRTLAGRGLSESAVRDRVPRRARAPVVRTCEPSTLT